MSSEPTTNDLGETKAAIMEATYRAVLKHGFAGLTTQAIADEFDKTKAVLHYHYDSKEELLVAFLEYLIAQFEAGLDVTDDDPVARLEFLIDVLLLGSEDGDPHANSDHWEFHRAFLEVRSRAVHNDAYREQLTENYERIFRMFRSTIKDGVEAGVFRDVDPDLAASLLFAAVDGGRIQQVAYEREETAATVREAIDELLLSTLLIEGADDRTDDAEVGVESADEGLAERDADAADDAAERGGDDGSERP